MSHLGGDLMNTKGLMNYIEDIRYGRNMTQEALLDGVISRRQYQRYRNDDTYVPLDIVEKLSVRLGIPYRKLLLEFESEEFKQSVEIKKYYNLVVAKRYNEAEKLEEIIKGYHILDDERELDFKCAYELKRFFSGLVSLPEMLRFQASLIGYPEINDKEIITDGEALVLGIIQEYSEQDREQIIVKLEQLITDDLLQINGGNFLAKLQLLFYIAKYYGRIKDYSKVIKYCDMGVVICENQFSHYLLEYFSYYKALAFHRLGKIDEFENALSRCAMTLLVQGNKQNTDKFEKYFMKDLNMNLYEFMLTYLNTRIER